jgi:hypothetical protein
VLRNDDELRERYQRAWVTARALRAQAQEFRRRGEVDVLAEVELALNQGRMAACQWLLGMTPAAPVTSVPAEVTMDRVAEELKAAEETAGGPELFSDLPDSFEGDPRWADGVVAILRWQLARQRQIS